ncbi:MAG: putative ABC transporter permease [Tenericutes bacterium]|nr:putative ABC transporter permease [Mycoplasmatota bacterium]
MIYKVSILFLLFMIYSILGWLMEITYVSFCEKRFTYNRGVLIGPYCPIYGIGVITIILFLNKYYEDAFVLFIMATIVCSIIEYITSYLLEKVYNARWWDYSKKRYHINGRICLSNALAFGVASLVVMYVIHPFIINFLYTFNSNIIIIISSY